MRLTAAIDDIDARTPTEVLDLLPTGVLMIDDHGCVRSCNSAAVDMLAATRDELVGVCLIDLLAPDEVEFGIDLLSDGTGFQHDLLGPVRIPYTALDGSVRNTEFWSRRLPDDEGFVLTSAPDSAAQALADAATSIAAGSPVDETVSIAVRGLAAYPFRSRACVLRVVDGQLEPMTPWPLGEFDPTHRDVPWQHVLDTRRAHAVDTRSLPAHFRHRARDADLAAMWCRPILLDQETVSAVLVVFRDAGATATANQERQTDQIVSMLELAFAQSRYRRSLEEAALRDPLTGLGNRAQLERLADDDEDFAAVLYLDLDEFKRVNDDEGHPAGDEVLRAVGRRLIATVRSDDHVIRIGGDEFVVVLAPLDDNDLERIADRLVERLSEPYSVGGGAVVDISASIGISRCDHAPVLRDALAAADDALLDAKRSGKRRWRIATAPV